MSVERLHLKDFYKFLGENGKDATVDIYLPAVITEMKRENTKRQSRKEGHFFSALSVHENEPNGAGYVTKQ